MTARLRVRLPVTTSISSMSVSYTATYLGLMLFDPHVATLIALTAGLALEQARGPWAYPPLPAAFAT